MRKLALGLVLMVLGFSTGAAPKSHKCPVCSHVMVWTGQTRTEWAKVTYEMKCALGHVTWEVDEYMARNKDDPSRCQFDGMKFTWNGNTRAEYGKLLKEYECPAGHKIWRVLDGN